MFPFSSGLNRIKILFATSVQIILLHEKLERDKDLMLKSSICDEKGATCQICHGKRLCCCCHQLFDLFIWNLLFGWRLSCKIKYIPYLFILLSPAHYLLFFVVVVGKCTKTRLFHARMSLFWHTICLSHVIEHVITLLNSCKLDFGIILWLVVTFLLKE